MSLLPYWFYLFECAKRPWTISMDRLHFTISHPITLTLCGPWCIARKYWQMPGAERLLGQNKCRTIDRERERPETDRVTNREAEIGIESRDRHSETVRKFDRDREKRRPKHKRTHSHTHTPSVSSRRRSTLLSVDDFDWLVSVDQKTAGLPQQTIRSYADPCLAYIIRNSIASSLYASTACDGCDRWSGGALLHRTDRHTNLLCSPV